MTRPDRNRRSITAGQIDLLASMLRLSPATAQAVHGVLVGGMTHAAAAQVAGLRPPNVSRAVGAVRRLDAAIRDAYAPQQAGRQRAREASDVPT